MAEAVVFSPPLTIPHILLAFVTKPAHQTNVATKPPLSVSSMSHP